MVVRTSGRCASCVSAEKSAAEKDSVGKKRKSRAGRTLEQWNYRRGDACNEVGGGFLESVKIAGSLDSRKPSP